MSEDEMKKLAVGKMYNLKSGVEGIIQMTKSGVMSGQQAVEGAAALVASSIDEFNKQAGIQ